MSHTTLITASELYHNLSNPGWLVVDCRFTLADPDKGRQDYLQAHIPGAVYAHLDRDLTAPDPALAVCGGRHPLPVPELAAQSLGRLGIGSNLQIVTYDSAGGALAAARLWWLLRWLGHPHAAVLDGGLKQWLAKGLPVTASLYTPSPKAFIANPDNQLLADSLDVMALRDGGDWKLLDARAPERYAGEVEPLDPVAGHVPGALNHPLARNLTAEGRLANADMLRTQFLQELGGTRASHVINMCGSGVTACHNVLAMEIAGLSGSKLYAGSWSEWCKDPQHPVATGHQP